MTTLGLIALLCVAFAFGAIVGVILISMCFSNERYDDDQASYELGVKRGELIGRSQMREEMMSLCSHCTYKRECVETFDELREVRG